MSTGRIEFKCPYCGEPGYAWIEGKRGYTASFLDPGEPDELADVTGVEFECACDFNHGGFDHETNANIFVRKIDRQAEEFWRQVGKQIEEGDIDWNEPDPDYDYGEGWDELDARNEYNWHKDDYDV